MLFHFILIERVVFLCLLVAGLLYSICVFVQAYSLCYVIMAHQIYPCLDIESVPVPMCYIIHVQFFLVFPPT